MLAHANLCSSSSTFEAYLIWYSISRYFPNTTPIANSAALDVSSSRAISDEATFIPGVTPGLMIFLVFGTTAPCRATYAQWLGKVSPCSLCRSQQEPRDDSSNSAGLDTSAIRLNEIKNTQVSHQITEWHAGHALDSTMSRSSDSGEDLKAGNRPDTGQSAVSSPTYGG